MHLTSGLPLFKDGDIVYVERGLTEYECRITNHMLKDESWCYELVPTDIKGKPRWFPENELMRSPKYGI